MGKTLGNPWKRKCIFSRTSNLPLCVATAIVSPAHVCVCVYTYVDIKLHHDAYCVYIQNLT